MASSTCIVVCTPISVEMSNSSSSSSRRSSICFLPSKIVSSLELIESRVFAIAFENLMPISLSTAASCACSSSIDLSSPNVDVENLSSLFLRQKNAIYNACKTQSLVQTLDYKKISHVKQRAIFEGVKFGSRKLFVKFQAVACFVHRQAQNA